MKNNTHRILKIVNIARSVTKTKDSSSKRKFRITYRKDGRVKTFVCEADDAEDARNQLDEFDDFDKIESIYVIDNYTDSIKDADKYTFRLSKKTNDYDEYTIKCFKNGARYSAGDYMTDDWDDAIGTLKDLAKRNGLTYHQQGSMYVADCASLVKDDDDDELNDDELDDLIAEEYEAIADYSVTLAICKSEHVKTALQHILEEEKEHVKELEQLRQMRADRVDDARVSGFLYPRLEKLGYSREEIGKMTSEQASRIFAEKRKKGEQKGAKKEISERERKRNTYLTDPEGESLKKEDIQTQIENSFKYLKSNIVLSEESNPDKFIKIAKEMGYDVEQVGQRLPNGCIKYQLKENSKKENFDTKKYLHSVDPQFKGEQKGAKKEISERERKRNTYLTDPEGESLKKEDIQTQIENSFKYLKSNIVLSEESDPDRVIKIAKEMGYDVEQVGQRLPNGCIKYQLKED